jgi:hypothetical protein
MSVGERRAKRPKPRRRMCRAWSWSSHFSPWLDQDIFFLYKMISSRYLSIRRSSLVMK